MNRIERLIANSGPMSISQFISLCLADKEQGYYHHAEPFGTGGDFITAPEISQMFGEILGLWVVHSWQQLERFPKSGNRFSDKKRGENKKPEPLTESSAAETALECFPKTALRRQGEFIFCEMGPGRGTLMADMIRTLKKIAPDFFEQVQIILIETSRKLRAVIAEKLKPYNLAIKFVDTIDELPPLPLILIANELLDCLPIHQYVRGENGWHERMVGLDAKDGLRFVLSPHPIKQFLKSENRFLDKNYGKTQELEHGSDSKIAPNDLTPPWLPPHASGASVGALIEISPAREGLIERLGQHVFTHGGSALFIDYGSLTGGFGDTLQALSKHQYQDPLAAPGCHDLTSHVDFAALVLRAQVSGCATFTATQGEFLEALGIRQRAAQLCAGRDSEFQQKIIRDLERLTADQEMGNLFKIFCLQHYPHGVME